MAIPATARGDHPCHAGATRAPCGELAETLRTQDWLYLLG